MGLLFNRIKDRLIATAKKGDHFSRIKFHFFYGLHNRLLKSGQQDYVATVHGAKMTLPPEHLLPVFTSIYPLQERPLSEIAADLRQRDGYLNLIDVGANVGDSILIIDQTTKIDTVVAIEGSDKFFPYLRKNTEAVSSRTKVLLEKRYLADKTESRKIKISEDYGTGSLIQDDTGAAEDLMSLDDLIAEKYNDVKWNLMKVDTDGFDFMIMRGSSRLLSSKDISLFFEFDPSNYGTRNEDPLKVFEYLRSVGFKRIIFYNNLGEKMFDISIDNTDIINQLITYNLTYRRFHYDVLAVKN